MWAQLFNQYWRVSIFKESPANTPYSILLLILSGLIFFLLLLLQWQMTDIDKQFMFPATVWIGISLVASYLVYTYALLRVFRKPNRLVQTLTCLFAGHTIVHLFAFPLLLLAPMLIKGGEPTVLDLITGIVYLIFTLVLTVWQFMIAAFVLREALKIDYLPSILASFGLLAANILIVTLWR